MAMVNNLANVKDSRWLQLEVCREYQRNKCTRPDTECKFAHPPANVEVQNGRVIACYDSIKGRCNREKPPCKYFHPPSHLKDQLLINGRNHLALKNALMQQMPLQPVQLPAAAVVSAAVPSPLQAVYAVQQAAQQRALSQILNGNAAVAMAAAAAAANNGKMGSEHLRAASNFFRLYSPYDWMDGREGYGCSASSKATANPYMTGLPTIGSGSTFGPYLTHSPMMASLLPADPMTTSLSVLPTALVTPQKVARTDRLEVCREFQRGNCKRPETECRFAHPPEHVTVDTTEGLVTVCMDFVKGRCSREPCRYFHPPPHLQAQLKAAQSRANAAAMTHVVESVVGKKRLRDPPDELILAFPGMAYSKRPALDKSGVPVYQPGTAAYQQALAMQVQQPFVPVSYVDPYFVSVAGHPASVPRF